MKFFELFLITHNLCARRGNFYFRLLFIGVRIHQRRLRFQLLIARGNKVGGFENPAHPSAVIMELAVSAEPILLILAPRLRVDDRRRKGRRLWILCGVALVDDV